MNILTIPLRCARQKWPRTLSLVAIFLLGAASVVALHKVSVTVSEGFERKLAAFGANIIISPKRETLTISYGGVPLGDMMMHEGRMPLSASLGKIRGIPLNDRLALVAPKLVGIVRYEGKPLAVVGVDIDQELDLKRFWNVRGAFPGESAATGGAPADDETDAPEALAGSAPAGLFGFEPGQTLLLGGRTLTISGVLHPTGSDDDNVLFVPLSVAQALLHAGDAADFMEVAALCSGCPIEDIVAELRAALPENDVKALRQVVAQRMYSINFAGDLAMIGALVIVIAACAMIVMSMLSAVHERRKEIGILRAIGFSRRAVSVVFALEAFGIGALAGAAGYCLGLEAAARILAALDMAAPLAFSVLELTVCFLAAGLLAVLSAAGPAVKAAHVDPAAALASL